VRVYRIQLLKEVCAHFEPKPLFKTRGQCSCLKIKHLNRVLWNPLLFLKNYTLLFLKPLWLNYHTQNKTKEENKMKRTVVCLIFALIASMMAAALLTGCGSEPENDFEPPEYVYFPDVVPLSLPDGIDWIDNVTVSGDKIYFTASGEFDEDFPFHFNDIFTMDLDGTNIKKLPDYIAAAEFPADAEQGNVQIYSIYIDKTGNIWVAERGEFFYFPEDTDDDDWERWYSRKIVEEFTRVRKLNDTGSELLSFDIGHLSSGSDWFYISDFAIDDESNIYIGSDSTIHVLSSEGKPLFTLDVQWVERFISMQDGSVAHMGWGGRGRELSKIDVAGRSFSSPVDLPDNAHNIYSGNDEYSLLFSDNNGLYGIEALTGESVLLLNWIDSDMTLEGLGSITFLSDGRILVTSQTWNSGGARHELVFLTKTPYSELPDRITLTLATFYLDWNIRNAIVQFNRSSTTHRISVTDYSEFNTDDDWQAGVTRLSAEIIAGNVPDILDVSNLPFDQYVAKDLLVDLYPLIDSDPELSRGDFLESVLRATEINGGLYKVFPTFSVITMLGHPSVVGSYPGWNMDEFIKVLDSNPDADFALGQGLTKLNFLQALFMFSMDDFVDRGAGKVNFESNDFIALLEFANTLPDDYDWDNYISEPELIATGRQIITATGFNSFDDFQMYRAMFGGDIVFKGLPAENRNGFSLTTYTGFAITNKCRDVDGAWEFLRTFLNEDWQNESIWYGMPTNKNAFNKLLEKAMTEDEYGSRFMSWDGFMLEMETLTQADADQIMALIDSASGSVGQDDALWTIISECASDFFSGKSTAQDAARIIQNRASIYISEQS